MDYILILFLLWFNIKKNMIKIIYKWMINKKYKLVIFQINFKNNKINNEFIFIIIII